METIGKIDQQETLADNFCEDLDTLETEVHDWGLDFKTTMT